MNNIYLRNESIDFKLFILGLFLLPAAPIIACLFFLYPLLKGVVDQRNIFFKDRLNFLLIIISFLMILRCFFEIDIDINDSNYLKTISANQLNWIGLSNWIPLFLCYFSFQKYLNSEKRRIIVSKVFIASSIPVLVSGFNQYFFNLYGPYEFLNGLIIWFQKAPTDPSLLEGEVIREGLTSLFSNQNYAGSWLTMIWPFCLTTLLINLRKRLTTKVLISFLICIAFVISIVLTLSRNALLGLLISIPLIMGQISKIYLIIPLITIFFLIPFALLNLPKLISQNQLLINKFIPLEYIDGFSSLVNSPTKISRIFIWKNAIEFITQRPLFGWGAAIFPILFALKYDLEVFHTHNLFLELAMGYGVIIALLVLFFFLTILISSYGVIFKKKEFNNLNNCAWWVSFFIFLISQLYDVAYYDLRISISCWIFIAGLRSITNQEDGEKVFH